jgi:pSer/pThr/pTyr-binding forkhead associated (FHA) protein
VSFVLQRVMGRGLVLNQVNVDALRIGRGTNAELRSDNPVVALEHAVIEADAAGYTITDKGSITGTYVNRRPVESARLAKGDVIEIGELRIEVQLAEPGRPMFLRVDARGRRAPALAQEAGDAAAPPPGSTSPNIRGGTVRAEPVDYAAAYRLRRPWLTKLSLAALAALVAIVVTTEILQPGNQTVFRPGGLSSAHSTANAQLVAKNCSACHDPWRGVVDARCRDCHKKEPHAVTEAVAPPCTSCHHEHRGEAKLAANADATCSTCHADLQKHVKAGVVLAADRSHIEAFGEHHPELSYFGDANTLRFNHKLHLQPRGIFNASGKREVLQCTTCHKLVESRDRKLDPKPVTFAADCQRCHKLTFDGRFPNDEAPHGGDPGILYGYVISIYSGNRDLAAKSPDEVRRILTSRPAARVDENANIAVEHVIKTKCVQCHEIRRTGSRLAVTPPVLRNRWLKHAGFTHTAHSGIDCERCHESARKSATTVDVLMPARKECTACHGAGGAAKSATTCRTCHDYHERSTHQLTKMAALMPPPAAGGPPNLWEGEAGMLNMFFVAAAVVLLLVILIPVGAAVYQRLRPRELERVAQRPAAAQPPPAMPPMAVPSAPAPPVAQPPKPRNAPPTEPPGADATRIVQLPDLRGGDPQPEGTVVVQWYGMLFCSEGELEGKHFPIDDEGFYIGRDAVMSQVVINDNRVSKRHVRIVPRDGKVHAIDQGSTNGTFIGSTTSARITDVQLKRGDKLILGDNVATFVYQI